MGRCRRRHGARRRSDVLCGLPTCPGDTRVPIVAALSGRPAPPRQIHRSAIPGIVCLVGAFLLLGYSGSTNSGNGSGGAPELVFGLVLLIPGLILLAPFFLSLAARLARRAPIAPRLALRDLARYRARSGSALAAISIGVLVAVIVMLAAASRYGNVLDYAGPNLASNELALHINVPLGGGTIGPNAQGQVNTRRELRGPACRSGEDCRSGLGDRKRARRAAHRPREPQRQYQRHPGGPELGRTDLRRHPAVAACVRYQSIRHRSRARTF